MLLVCFSRPEMTSPSTGCPGPLPGPLGGSSLVPFLPPSDLDFWACACTSLAQSWCTGVGVWQLPVCGLEGEEPHLYRAGQAQAAFPAQKGGSPSPGVPGCLSQSGKSQCLPGARSPPLLVTHQRPEVNSILTPSPPWLLQSGGLSIGVRLGGGEVLQHQRSPSPWRLL